MMFTVEKKRKPALFLLLLVILLMSLAVPVYAAYDQGTAQRYADQYVYRHNSSYPDKTLLGGDCANFVSQCLTAGGLPWTTRWNCNIKYTSGPQTGWYPSPTAAFINADELKNYMRDSVATLIGRWAQTDYYNTHGYRYYGYLGHPNSNNIQGLGSEVIFYDWQGNGKMDHAAIVVGTNRPFYYTGHAKQNQIDYSQPVGDLINQHTTDRQHQYWHLDYYNGQRATTELYGFRLK